MLVSEKLAVLPTPAAAAVTVKLPANPFAVSTPEVACPCPLVTAVFPPPANVPPAPLPGNVNVTVTPAHRVAAIAVRHRDFGKGLPNAVFTVVLCPVPPVAAIPAAAPAVLVSMKLAVPATPATVAVTV